MNEYGPDLSESILQGFSWCVDSHFFDVEKRIYSISVIDNPDDAKSKRSLFWRGIKEFELKEVDDEPIDPDCMPSLIGIHQIENGDGFRVFIQTDIHTVLLKSEHPFQSKDENQSEVSIQLRAPRFTS
ncbi:MAG: hypothetical protein ACSHYA_13495 [Opitutaceae bacterium]